MNAAGVSARLYAPTARQLLDQLPDIAEGIARRMSALERAPDLAALDSLIRDAAGLGPLLMRLRETLVAEAAAGGSPAR
jgi:hypothetical protein